MDIVFANPEWIHGVWVALAVTGLVAYLDLRGKDALARFVSVDMQSRLAHGVTMARRTLKLALMLATLLLGVVALMRPQTPGGTQSVPGRQLGADVMVVLDVSRSMLAEDAAPNRLARAKADIGEFVSRVRGHRVGLVAFSGRAAVLCPLTTDYGFFHLVLDTVNTDSVARGGTRIGDALRKAVAAFGPNRGAGRLLLLVTDGEDHASYPRDAAEAAVAAGIRVVGIGFGSESGSEITLTDRATGAKRILTDGDGNVVRSRLDGQLLRDLALATEGVYVPAGTSPVDIDAIVEAHVEPLVREDATQVLRRAPTEHYHWLALAASLCLLGAVWVAAPGRPPRTAGR